MQLVAPTPQSSEKVWLAYYKAAESISKNCQHNCQSCSKDSIKVSLNNTLPPPEAPKQKSYSDVVLRNGSPTFGSNIIVPKVPRLKKPQLLKQRSQVKLATYTAVSFVPRSVHLAKNSKNKSKTVVTESRRPSNFINTRPQCPYEYIVWQNLKDLQRTAGNNTRTTTAQRRDEARHRTESPLPQTRRRSSGDDEEYSSHSSARHVLFDRRINRNRRMRPDHMTDRIRQAAERGALRVSPNIRSGEILGISMIVDWDNEADEVRLYDPSTSSLL